MPLGFEWVSLAVFQRFAGADVPLLVKATLSLVL